MPDKGNEGRFRSLLRSFVRTFPPLKIALYINDFICYLFSLLVDGISYTLRNLYRFTLFINSKIFKPVYDIVSNGFSRVLLTIPVVRKFKESRDKAKYERLLKRKKRRGENQLHQEPIPYRDQLIRRSITYHGGLLLALFLYVFIYFVLIKHHTYVSVSVAFVLLLVYLTLIENSHHYRSILMLCLPIMFTNRGRALVFCCMLTLLSTGPIKSLQFNVKEIHSSLICCKQYLIVKADKQVGENVVNKLVRVEEVVIDLVENIKKVAGEIRQKFDGIIELALATEHFVVDTVRKLKQIVNLCNHHTNDMHTNCMSNVNKLSVECRNLFNPFNLNFCKVFSRLREICGSIKLPQALCELPQHVVAFFQRTIGEKLAEYVTLIEKEFYVDIEVTRQYEYNVTKSKSYGKVTSEIKFDVENKFWYVHIVRRVFNLLSLILVIWIFATATFYHIHYLSEIQYDNMYLDERLNEIEELRKMGALKLDTGTSRQIKRASVRGRDDKYELALEQPTIRSADSAELARARGPPRDLNNNERGNSDNNNNNNNNKEEASDYNDNIVTVRSDESQEDPQSAGQQAGRRSARELAAEFDPLRKSPAADISGGSSINEDDDDVYRDAGANVDNKAQRVRLDEQTGPSSNLTKKKKKRKNEKSKSKRDDDRDDDDEVGHKQREKQGELDGQQQQAAGGKQLDYLFPMTQAHTSHYLRPFGCRMNKTEMSKLYWSGLVWLVINGYIMFFLALDFAFYQLVHFLVETLREILFTSDLPLVDVQTKSRDATGETNVVKYNRTYLRALRNQRHALHLLPTGQQQALAANLSNSSLTSVIEGHKDNSTSSSSIKDFYDRLMRSVERDIPDDVAILESLEQCLPQPEEPAYGTYKLLLYLALITFGAVIVEAYALRTRHCIANLYYPRRARKRALWLYRKLLSERPKYDDDNTLIGDGGAGSKQDKKVESSLTSANEFFKPQYDFDDETKNNLANNIRDRQRRERRKQMRKQAKEIGYKLLEEAINKR